MKIIKNLLYIVSLLLCISNVFAMQNNIPVALDQDKEGLYIFKDGSFCSVFIAGSNKDFNFVIGRISRQPEVYISHIIGPSFQACTRMDLKIKNYQKKDVIFFQKGHYPAHSARMLLNTEKILQIVEENKKKKEDANVTPDTSIKKIKMILSNNMKSFFLTGVVVGSALVFVVYSMYKKNKAKQKNKTDDLAKTDDTKIDDVAEKENDMLLLEELNQ